MPHRDALLYVRKFYSAFIVAEIEANVYDFNLNHVRQKRFHFIKNYDYICGFELPSQAGLYLKFQMPSGISVVTGK